MDTLIFLGRTLGFSFSAGINLYATVALLGLASRYDWVALPPQYQVFDNNWIIGTALFLYTVEFFADKIPAFDLLWNALQTFVRVPVAALIAWGATAQLSPADQVLAAALGAAIAFAAHSGKMAARAAVSPSPEPVSNSLLSLAEDLVAVGLTWFATQHPYLAGAIVAVLLVVLILLIRWVWRAMKALFRGAGEELRALEHRA